MSDINYENLFSTAATQRLGTMGARRGLGGVGGPQVKYSFEGGMPDPSTFPMEGIADATRRALQKDPLALNYGGIMGFDGMRDQVIEMEKIFGGRVPTRDNIMITSGASQALHLAYGALINAGDTIILESESYIAQQVKMYNPKIETVAVDTGGPTIAGLRQKLEELKVKGVHPKFFYTITGFHNPLGITFSRERLEQLLALAYEYNFLILEDDPYSRIRFSGEDVPSLYSLDAGGRHVLRMGTVSKILGAGMRIGWVIGEPEMLRALQQFKQDGGTNPFAQRVAAEYWREHLWSHIDEVTASYKKKRDTMMAAMQAYCKDFSKWNTPEGGIFLWVDLNKDVDDTKLLQYSEQESVAYRPGSAFSSNGGGKGHLRLAYSFQDPETITEGIKRLGRAMAAASD